MAMPNGYDQGFDWVGGGAVYPGSYDSIAMAANQNDSGAPISGEGGVVTAGQVNMLQANPVTGAVVFIALVALLMALVHHFGAEDGDFRNLKASFYNVVIVSLVATAGIPLWKTLFAQMATWKIPFAAEAAAYAQAA